MKNLHPLLGFTEAELMLQQRMLAISGPGLFLSLQRAASGGSPLVSRVTLRRLLRPAATMPFKPLCP